MKKKLLIFLIFLIVLIVIFLIRLIIIDIKLENIINNTVNKIKKDDYKITLTLKEEGLVSQKLKYEETRHINTYKFKNSMFSNDTLEKSNIYYLDNNTYYYSVNNEYKTKEVKNINEIKDFKFDFKKIFNMMSYKSSYRKNNKNYFTLYFKSSDIFSLIYGNSSDKKNIVKVTLVSSNNKIENIKFEDDSIKVNLSLEFVEEDVILPMN